MLEPPKPPPLATPLGDGDYDGDYVISYDVIAKSNKTIHVNQLS